MEWYIGTEWECKRKGLHKKVLSLDFKKLNKPHMVAKVKIHVTKVENLDGRPSGYLQETQINQDVLMEMGTALSPVDYYLEILVQQMIEGETALCTIRTKQQIDDANIRVIITLKHIEYTKETHKLTVLEMYQLALQYKECGVKIFKTYLQFAHEYFIRAAKCLISYKKFDNLTKKHDGVDGNDMQDLLYQIQTNITACLLIEKRYEDAIYQTQFVGNIDMPPEKAIYRRALAFYHMNEFESARRTIELAKDFKKNKEFVNLYEKIRNSWKVSNNQYKGMVQKMFP